MKSRSTLDRFAPIVVSFLLGTILAVTVVRPAHAQPPAGGWEVSRSISDVYNRPDWDKTKILADQGWEPFAVDNGNIYFRRRK